MKIVYRSKADFFYGTPKNKEVYKEIYRNFCCYLQTLVNNWSKLSHCSPAKNTWRVLITEEWIALMSENKSMQKHRSTWFFIFFPGSKEWKGKGVHGEHCKKSGSRFAHWRHPQQMWRHQIHQWTPGCPSDRGWSQPTAEGFRGKTKCSVSVSKSTALMASNSTVQASTGVVSFTNPPSP